jgi:hypothetical protein
VIKLVSALRQVGGYTLVVHTHHEYMYLKLSMDEQLIEVSVLIRQSKQPIVDHLPLTVFYAIYF